MQKKKHPTTVSRTAPLIRSAPDSGPFSGCNQKGNEKKKGSKIIKAGSKSGLIGRGKVGCLPRLSGIFIGSIHPHAATTQHVVSKVWGGNTKKRGCWWDCFQSDSIAYQYLMISSTRRFLMSAIGGDTPLNA